MSEMRPLTILIAALGGEGGGVLADWIVAAATIGGYPVQSTSIPGVAQRTGRHHLLSGNAAPTAGGAAGCAADVRADADGRRPRPGRRIRAGRGRACHPERLRDAEAHDADRRHQSRVCHRRAQRHGRRAVRSRSASWRWQGSSRNEPILFDAGAAARAAGVPINAVLLGAIVASGVLRLERAWAEEAIRQIGQIGRSQSARLRGRRAGSCRRSRRGSSETCGHACREGQRSTLASVCHARSLPAAGARR